MWHWSTLITGVVIINLMVYIVHKAGPWGIALTWLPGRVIALMAQIQWLDTPGDMLVMAQYTSCACLVPVLFLLSFHTYMPGHHGRLPRFKCAHFEWIACWILAIVALGIASGIVLWASPSRTACITIATAAALLNVVNTYHAPGRVRTERMPLSVRYFFAVNVVSIATLTTIAWCTAEGYLLEASLLSNLPIFSMVLLIGSSCFETPAAIWTTRQHVYMLSYQAWPSLVFIFCMFIPGSTIVRWSVALITLTSVIIIQYQVVKPHMVK